MLARHWKENGVRQGMKLRMASLKNIPTFFFSGGGGIKSSFPGESLIWIDM